VVASLLPTVAERTDSESIAAELDLIRRAQTGDEAAFGEVVRAHYEQVFRRVLAVTRNEHDARDVTQEVWVSVWQSLKNYRAESRFSTWLYAVATRRAIDHLRKQRRWLERFLPFLVNEETGESIEPPSPDSGPRDRMERTENDQRFERAIASLPPKHQAVLALREVEGLSYEEIARTLKCRTGTVMSRLFNARRQLAQKLGDLPCE
jgi:RNA polymerase sigma-70 factor, ECF subfamily